MKIGLISDIHGNSLALEVVLAALADEVDQIMFLGDLCGYYSFVEECVALWDNNRILGIRGNHDQVLLDCFQRRTHPSNDYHAKYGSALMRTLENVSPAALSLLESLPVSRTLRLKGVTLVLYHGSPWDPLDDRVYPDYDNWERFSDVSGDVILLGHTHYPLVKQHRHKLIVNPGSVGQPRDHSRGACYAEIDLASGEVTHHRATYDATPLIRNVLLHDPDLPYLTEVLTR